ncbi:MAG: hypothetical protein P8Y45_23375 [Exilibacterium sp.]
MKFINIIIVSVLSICMLLSLLTAVDFYSNSEAYRFGTEVYDWRYQSPQNYIFSFCLELFVAAVGIFSFVFIKRPLVLLVVRVAAVLFYASFAFLA